MASAGGDPATSSRPTDDSLSQFIELTAFVDSTFSTLEIMGDERKAFVTMIAHRLQLRSYGAHEIVIRKGDKADTMCFVYKGSAEVFLENPPEEPGGASPRTRRRLGRESRTMTSSHDLMAASQDLESPGSTQVRPVAVLEEDSYFGEAALVAADDEAAGAASPVRNACVRARTDLEVYLLSREALSECMVKHPAIKSVFEAEQAAKAASNAKLAAQRSRAVKMLSAGFFMQVCGNCATIAARPNYLLSFAGNDAAIAASLMSAISSAGSVLEFLFGPCFGRLSDCYGRLPFLMIGPFGSALCDGMVFAYPSKATVVIGKVISGMTVTAFITMTRGSLADVAQGEEFALANSRMAVWSGLGIIISPWICARFLTDRSAYLFSAVFALINGVMLMTNFRETLPLSERKPVNWLACNPFTFLKLFTHSKTMTLLVLAVGFQSLGEIRFAFDIAMIIWRRVHGLSAARTGDFSAMLGVGYVVAGQVGLVTIKKFGQRGHTTWSNLMNVIANGLWAFDTGERGTIVGQIVMSLAHRKRDGLEAMIYRLGTSRRAARARAIARGDLQVKPAKEGTEEKQEAEEDDDEEEAAQVETWGRGEVSGWLANFKSVTWICAPQLYALAYALGTRGERTFYGAPMLLAALTAVASQLCVLRLPSMARFQELCGGRV